MKGKKKVILNVLRNPAFVTTIDPYAFASCNNIFCPPYTFRVKQ